MKRKLSSLYPLLNKSLFIALLLLIQSMCIAQAIHKNETGVPFIDFFSPETYSAHGQNFSVAQKSNGILYFANFAGVLEYDGHYWRLVTTDSISRVSALYADTSGLVFVGANNEFGYLTPDSSGMMNYQELGRGDELSGLLYGPVLSIFQQDNSIYFITKNYVFSYTDSIVSVTKQERDKILNVFHVNNKAYITQEINGLSIFKNGGFEKIIIPQSFSWEEEIVSILPFNKESELLITSNHGLFIIRDNSIRKFKSGIDNIIHENICSGGIRVNHDAFAIGTSGGDIYIVNKSGIIEQNIKNHPLLKDQQVNYWFKGKDNTLWLALNNGICRVHLPSALSVFDESTGLRGQVNAITRFGGKMFFASHTGLYFIHNFDVYPVDKDFSASCRDLSIYNNSLLIATNQGIFRFMNAQIKEIYPGFALSLQVLKNRKNSFIAGFTDKALLFKLSENGTFHTTPIPGISDEIIDIVEDHDGTIWFETLSKGIYRLNPNSTYAYQDSLNFGISTHKLNKLSLINGKTVVSSPNGIYNYNASTYKFEKNIHLKQGNDVVKNWFGEIYEDIYDNVWTIEGDETNLSLFLKSNNLNYNKTELQVKSIADFEIKTMYSDHDSIMWFGCSDKVFRLDRKHHVIHDTLFYTLIRKVLLHNDSLLFAGNIKTAKMVITAPFELKHNENSLQFEFAAPSFHAKEKIMFQYYMKGFDNSWSEWTYNHFKEYTNLPDKKFTFQVRAKNIYGDISEQAQYHFTIKTPPYRTPLAIVIYIILFGTIVYLLVKWRLNQLMHEKHALEQTIQERTSEITEQKEELEQQSSELALKNEQLEKIDIIVKSINKEVHFTNLFQNVLTNLRIIKNMECATALVYNKKTDNYSFEAIHGCNMDPYKDISLTYEEVEHRYIYKADEVYEDIYLKNNPRFKKLGNDLDNAEPPKSILTIVIVIESKVEGFVTLANHSKENAFDRQDVNMVKNIKEHLVAAFIKTKILENLEQTLTNLKNTQQELIRKEKLASIGQLTKGIVDRILNPLNYINNFSQLASELAEELTEELSDQKENIPDEVKEDFEDINSMLKSNLDKITEHGNSATRIVKSMEKLLRDKSTDFVEADLNDFVQVNTNDVLKSLTNKYPEFKLKTDIQTSRQKLPVKILPQELKEVLINILSNSFYAIYEKSKNNKEFQPLITIKTEESGGQAVFTLEDNGKGIAKQELDKLFSPFFTTKPTSVGTGLGLYMSKDIIQLHKGNISISSEEGKFTNTRIEFPLYNGETTE